MECPDEGGSLVDALELTIAQAGLDLGILLLLSSLDYRSALPNPDINCFENSDKNKAEGEM